MSVWVIGGRVGRLTTRPTLAHNGPFASGQTDRSKSPPHHPQIRRAFSVYHRTVACTTFRSWAARAPRAHFARPAGQEVGIRSSTRHLATVGPKTKVLAEEIPEWIWSVGAETFTFDQILNEVTSALADGGEVHVGTDSRLCSRETRRQVSYAIYASVVALHKPDSGTLCRYYVTKGFRQYYSLDDRIMEEANRSIQVAQCIQARVPDSGGAIFVHSDTSTDERWPTSRFTPAIRSWAMGLGFSFRAKPEAWAASTAADQHTH